MVTELGVEEREEFHKDVVSLSPIKLSLTFSHPLHSLHVRAFPQVLSPLVAISGQQIILVINTITHLWSEDTGPKLEEEL